MIALAVGGVAVSRSVGLTCEQRAEHRIARMHAEADQLFLGHATKTQDSTGCGGDGDTMVAYQLPLTPRREMTQAFVRRGWRAPGHQLMTSPDGSFTVQYYTSSVQQPGVREAVTDPPVHASKFVPRRFRSCSCSRRAADPTKTKSLRGRSADLR
jgi:hypothetical protein